MVAGAWSRLTVGRDVRLSNCRAAGAALWLSGCRSRRVPPMGMLSRVPFQITEGPPRGFEHEHQTGREAGNGRTYHAPTQAPIGRVGAHSSPTVRPHSVRASVRAGSAIDQNYARI